jgi:hypothetical protein
MAEDRSEYDKKNDGLDVHTKFAPNQHLPKWHDAVELGGCQLKSCPSGPNEP